MATTPRSPRILDLKPFLNRSRAAGDSRSSRSLPDTPLPGGSFDFVDVVDDTPPPSDGESLRAQAAHDRPMVTRTWRVFLTMLATGVVVACLATPLFFLLSGSSGSDQTRAVLFVAMLSSVVTGYLNYSTSRLAFGRILRRVQEQSRTLFQVDEAEDNAIQASEIDRLDETLASLLGELKQQMERQKRLERNDLIQTITALATAIEARDPYTRNHSRSVARWSVRLGRSMGLRRDQLYEMHLAGLMHDIGKIGVPDEVLLKPGKLTPDEVRAIQAHVEWSYSIISPITSLKQVSAIVRHHHERFDGKGYPDRLAGNDIPLGARIMAVVDMFVAMTENRPYRQGLSIDTAVEELRRVAGTQIDPTCMQAFLDVLTNDGMLSPHAHAPQGRADADALVGEAPAGAADAADAADYEDEDEAGSKRAAAN